MKTRTVVEYILAAIVVMILGAFVGWYFFLHNQTKETVARDVARGYVTPDSNAQPSFVSRMLSGITGEGTGISPTPGDGQFGQSSEATAHSSTSASVVEAKRPPQLWHVYAKPVAGMLFVSEGSGEKLRFVERATGYVYEADPETSTVTRVDNTLAPKIYEALLTRNGRIFQRSFDSAGRITTSVAMLNANAGSSTSKSASTTALALDISRIVVDPRSDDIFYLVREGGGVAGYRSQWNGARAQKIFSSSILHWNPSWLPDGRIVLTQAPASDSPGFAYEITQKDGARPLVRGVSGLTLLPRASGSLLFGESGQGGLTLYTQVSPTTTPTRLSVKTVADKCVWAPDTISTSTVKGKVVTKVTRSYTAYCGVPHEPPASDFIDTWHRGTAHTSDDIWRIDANAGTATIVYNPESNAVIDIGNLTIQSAGAYVAFINNTDQSLWVWRVEK